MKPQNLKRLRLELGLTCGYCAEGMNLTRQTINNIETGKCPLSTMKYYELYLKEIRSKRKYALDHRR